jgi:uncharacterized protein
MRRLLPRLLLALALIAPADLAVTQVYAQSGPVVQQRKDPISSFFGALFGGLTRRAQPTRTLPPTQQRSVGSSSSGSQGAVIRQRETTPRVVEAVKAPDAKNVVVFGDFFADGLQDGLKEAFLESSSVIVDGKSDASSGLVRKDHFDWPAAIEAWLSDPEKKTDIAVIMIGANDRQALSDASGEHEARSERWRELYAQRIDEVIEAFTDRKVPLYWVSLPPVASGRMSQDYAYFNDIYRERAYRYGIEFIDIWNSFVDEAGNYAAVGPDINGERRQLRADDGLHFTSPGNRKLAHFVAREIRRDFGREGGLFLALPQGQSGPQPFMPSDDQIRTGVGEVVALTGVQGGTGLALAGGPESTPEAPRDSSYFQVLLEGAVPDTAPGREDDFSWPRKPTPLPVATPLPSLEPEVEGSDAEAGAPAEPAAAQGAGG